MREVVTPSRWMVALVFSREENKLKPRVGRFRNADAPVIDDMEYFGGPENYFETMDEARALADVLNSPD